MKTDFMKALEHQALNVWTEAYLDTYRKLKSGVYHENHVDVIFQGKGYTASNVMAFAHIQHHINIGNIVTLAVNVGDAPLGDKAVAQNNRILSQLPKLFKAEFSPELGANAWSDGYVAAKGNVVLQRHVAPHVDKQYQALDKYLVFDLYHQQIPLEVGTTDGHITYMHLLTDGAVARWAYGSTKLVVLLTCNAIASEARMRQWKYHTATPLDLAIAKSQIPVGNTATEGKAA